MNTNLIIFGFLPVILYLIIDSMSGKRKALIGAFAIGLGEFVFSAIQYGALDYLSLISFVFMVVFIIASLRTLDDFYFKIHGALINIFTALVMLVAWYGFHKALLLDMAIKYVGLDKLSAMNPKLEPEFVGEIFRVLSYQLPAWLILHALITIYAAANWNKWAWAAVRVPGLILTLFIALAFAEIGVIDFTK